MAIVVSRTVTTALLGFRLRAFRFRKFAYTLDCDATATDKLYGKRLEWYSLGECAQTALEGLGLHIQTLHKKQRNVQTQGRAS